MKQKRRRQPKYKNQGKEFPNILNSMVRKSETEDKESDHGDVENLDKLLDRLEKENKDLNNLFSLILF